jgi:hypothetical protein
MRRGVFRLRPPSASRPDPKSEARNPKQIATPPACDSTSFDSRPRSQTLFGNAFRETLFRAPPPHDRMGADAKPSFANRVSQMEFGNRGEPKLLGAARVAHPTGVPPHGSCPGSPFGICSFGISDLFRISCFGFRASPSPRAGAKERPRPNRSAGAWLSITCRVGPATGGGSRGWGVRHSPSDLLLGGTDRVRHLLGRMRTAGGRAGDGGEGLTQFRRYLSSTCCRLRYRRTGRSCSRSGRGS